MTESVLVSIKQFYITNACPFLSPLRIGVLSSFLSSSAFFLAPLVCLGKWFLPVFNVIKILNELAHISLIVRRKVHTILSKKTYNNVYSFKNQLIYKSVYWICSRPVISNELVFWGVKVYMHLQVKSCLAFTCIMYFIIGLSHELMQSLEVECACELQCLCWSWASLELHID